MANIEKIKHLALKFRKAIEKAQPLLDHTSFASFPKGSCGDASLLLKKYLESAGIRGLKYATGINDNGHSHAWLIYGCLIIDITTDQFAEKRNKVFISEKSDFHDLFKCRLVARNTSIEDYDENTYKRLLNSYKIIKSFL